MASHKYDYDAIIIGAGISGLVCGCYLAKAGLKTLIVEKNAKPGGYCTSFTRNGFTFDACAHSLGSLREGGIIAKILKELSIENRIKFTRYSPQDIIITPDYKIYFWKELDNTVQELQNKFPKESKNIKDFMTFLDNSTGISAAELRNKTLESLLDEYFNDKKLKAILSILILGNMGLSPSHVSAFAAAKFYKEFIIDGGYYPEGGMQAFSDILAKRFKELGGSLSLSSLVTKMVKTDNTIKGVVIWETDFISAKYIISNCDATQTFSNLIGEENCDKEIIKKIHSLHYSLSMFILYLGVDKSLKNLPKAGSNIWFLPNYNIEAMYDLAKKGDIDNLDWFLLRLLPDKKSIIMLVNSPYKDSKYWKNNKDRLIGIFIKKIEAIIPDLSKHIILKDAATPSTLYKWTLNYKGASYGWESMPSQFAISGLSQVTPIKNLYLTGHWTTLAQGIPGVVYLGHDTAKIISGKERNRT